MLGSLISAVIGGAGGFGGAELVQNLAGLSAGGNLDGIIGALSGVVGGGAIGGLLGRGNAAAEAGQAAASGGINIKQIIGGLAGGAGAGAIVQAVAGMLMGG